MKTGVADMQRGLRPRDSREILLLFIISDVFEFRDGTKRDKCERGGTEMVVNGVWPKTAVMNRSR